MPSAGDAPWSWRHASFAVAFTGKVPLTDPSGHLSPMKYGGEERSCDAGAPPCPGDCGGEERGGEAGALPAGAALTIGRRLPIRFVILGLAPRIHA